MFSGPRKVRNVAVLISGGGSTLQTLLEMHHQFEIKLVVSNRKSAPGILKAKRFGKPLFILTKQYSFEELTLELEKHNISHIILAGFMKILPETFVERWKNQIINIHPSLLPEYKGLEAAERSWSDNSAMGVTLHYVTKEMDEGEILMQKTFLENPKHLDFSEAEILLRCTEQHLLRELAYRMAL